MPPDDRPFLVAFDGHAALADFIADAAEEAGFEAVAVVLPENRPLEATVAVAAADVLVVDHEAAPEAVAALTRLRARSDRPPLVILMADDPATATATVGLSGMTAQVISLLPKPLTAESMAAAFAAAHRRLGRQ